jgi:hypothetical protein
MLSEFAGLGDPDQAGHVRDFDVGIVGLDRFHQRVGVLGILQVDSDPPGRRCGTHECAP